ncbi:MAG: hypothetical protein JSS61_06060 [Verrucomicrobia bacterium]|nr:hypothetical protein [Verrucomicrobiota bacterium]
MKNQTSSNDPQKVETERSLIPRLKFMGTVFFFFSIASLLYAVLGKQEEQTFALAGIDLVEETTDDPHPHEVLNFYLVSTLFSSLGGTCFWIARSKQKTLHLGEIE